MELEITQSVHDMRSLEFHNPTPELRILIRGIMMDTYSNSEAYQSRQFPSTPFLQSDSPEYMLIEFWGPDPTPFVTYLQRRIDEEFGKDYTGQAGETS